VIKNLPDREGIVLIDKDRCLEMIKVLETKKIDVLAQIKMLLFQGKIGEGQVDLIMEAEQKKAVDYFFLDDGIEEE
jgi:hypothetical protein